MTITLDTVEQVVLDPSILDADTECDLADNDPYVECHAVAEYVGTMPCGAQFLACADHMARCLAGWADAIGCNCDGAFRSRKGVRVHWMVDVTWRRI